MATGYRLRAEWAAKLSSSLQFSLGSSSYLPGIFDAGVPPKKLFDRR
jgi:hypothetical protein